MISTRLAYSLAVSAGFMMILAAASSSAAGTHRIRIDNLAFAPATLKAHVGDTVEWVNADFVAHTATAKDGQWDVQLAAGGGGKTVLNKPGHISYYCKVHPTMTGEIDVLP
jgi:plastocyanin